MLSVARSLKTDIEVERFVENILRISNTDEKRVAINSIASAERNSFWYDDKPTLTHTDFRDFRYRENNDRNKLRIQILKELKEIERLQDDDSIKLGAGGAKPLTPIKNNRELFYIIGLPASGKSGIANSIADYFGAYILDSDYAKRKLPEYNNQQGGASLVHEESDSIIFNDEADNLLNYCLLNNYNMVIPKIGHNQNTILKFCEKMHSIDYKVNLISVDLDRTLATQRAFSRFSETSRYVPLSLIFDGYGNQPSLNYFKIKQKKPTFITGYAQISTDVPKGTSPKLLEQTNLIDFESLFGGIV